VASIGLDRSKFRTHSLRRKGGSDLPADTQSSNPALAWAQFVTSALRSVTLSKSRAIDI
jgi:hypothetical protein